MLRDGRLGHNMKSIVSCILASCLVMALVACGKPLATATVYKHIRYYSETVDANTTDALYAVRWALKINGYPIALENKTEGRVESTWLPTTTDSHVVVVFNRPDFGVNGAYYQLIVKVAPRDGQTRISVGSKIKSLVAGLRSTGIEERKVLAEVKDYLRDKEPGLTNIGIEE